MLICIIAFLSGSGKGPKFVNLIRPVPKREEPEVKGFNRKPKTERPEESKEF